MKCVLQVGPNNTSFQKGFYYVKGDSPTPYIHRATQYDTNEEMIISIKESEETFWVVVELQEFDLTQSSTPYFDYYENTKELSYV